MKLIRKFTKIILDLCLFISIFMFTFFFINGNKPFTIGSIIIWAICYFSLQYFNIIYYREIINELKEVKK